MLLVATSALLGDYLTEARVPQRVAQGIMDFTDNRLAILALLNVFFLMVGLFLHSAAAIILVVRIVMPLVLAAGIDPVHFGLVVTLNLGIGQQTPPVASVLVTACSVAKADIWEVSKVNLYFCRGARGHAPHGHLRSRDSYVACRAFLPLGAHRPPGKPGVLPRAPTRALWPERPS